MAIDHRAELKKIRSFPSLVRYLRDEMGWPIEGDDFEDLTFEYTPEELGIDAKNAAKIQEIKRLRPLSAKQPWGIFFVKFEPKQLPVVALRRILSQVALKKRASANSAERAAWAADDLLFVSNYGEGETRQISFAHFSQTKARQDLPTLKVLGWDNLDTALHLDDVAETLNQKLAWPDDEDNVEAWRETWQAAFTLRHREVVATSRELSMRLAKLARDICDRIRSTLAIETEKGPLTKLMKAFQESMVHDLDADGFADMYAQTIAYGLLSARIADPHSGTADDFAAHMRTNPFLKELMETFIKVGGRQGKAGGAGIDFDELGVSEVMELLDAANMEGVVRDFGDKNPLEDPVIHFYELFLKEYDATKRMQRGVFYTPRPVVSFIVRSVHEILRTEFGLADGLADTTTWDKMTERFDDLETPDGTDFDGAFVQILDPATGTGTFLVEVINVIYKTMTEKWQADGHGAKKIGQLWNGYVPKHLLPRLHGYELMMAPYAIAHMKIGLKLYETGYHFNSDERARVYLTNSLEPAYDFSGTFDFAIPALAHESDAVNAIKDHQRFTVIVGNPPYAQMSQNLNDYARASVIPYRSCDGQQIAERGALTFERNIQDDYIKFFRLGEKAIETSGTGILGLITNHAYLSNITLRGVRAHFLESFSNIRVLDLHGNSKVHEIAPDGVTDENIFDIQQGVAISLFSRSPDCKQPPKVSLAEIWGRREHKYANLLEPDWRPTFRELLPRPPQYLLRIQDDIVAQEYESFVSVTELFPKYGSAITTARDSIVVDFEDEPILERALRFQNASMSDSDLLKSLGISESSIWKVGRARASLKDSNLRSALIDVDYRPFDRRRLLYHDALISSPRHPTMDHMSNKESLAIAVCRQQGVPGFQHIFVSNRRFDEGLVSNRSREKTVCFPFWLTEEQGDLLHRSGGAPNISSALSRDFADAVGERWSLDASNIDGVVSPKHIFCYTYAILHSLEYRTRYEDFLQKDFPRIPRTASPTMFWKLENLGGGLIAMHLMESPRVNGSMTPLVGSGDFLVDKVSYSRETVWIDKANTRGFDGVPEEVWNFHIGAYQVCEKWLKDRQAKGGKNPRPGRVLTDEDIDHYQKIVVALSETIRIMKEIDEVIEDHGGWPDAFQSDDSPPLDIKQMKKR